MYVYSQVQCITWPLLEFQLIIPILWSVKNEVIADMLSKYIQLYSSFKNDSRKKTKTKTNNNKQETETRLNIISHINHIRSFRSRLAQPKTELHTELSVFINFVKNFGLRHTIKLDTDWILNMTRHSFTMSVDDVLNNFINRRVCIKCSDRLSATLINKLPTSFPAVPTSMTLNDFTPPLPPNSEF